MLRKTLLVSLDDLLAVVREFLNPEASRSDLDRCLRRHGVDNLRDLPILWRGPPSVHTGPLLELWLRCRRLEVTLVSILNV